MLDSSPVALGPSMASSTKNASAADTVPNPRKLLKRSASTASLASLPTPPRTRRRHARGRSRASVESDSDTYEDRGGDDAIMTSDDDEGEEAARRRAADAEHSDDEGVAAAGRHHPKPKRRRVGDARLDAADEEAFWLGGSSIATAGGANTHAGQDPVTTSKASQAPLLYRRLQAQATAVSVTLDAAPVSPPPSHRKTVPVVAAPAAVATHKDEEEPASRFSSPSPSPPSTPSRNARSQTLTSTPPPKHARLNALGGKAGAGPLFRDSPDNPFLVTPVKQKGIEGGNLDSDTDVRSPSASVTASSADPSPHTPSYGERPTVTYVFRGVRRTYQNPLYNHAENRPYSPPPQSKLPIDHPDYSPSVLCAPKVLFAEARFGRGHGRAKRHGQGNNAHAEARERTKRAERSASPSPTPGRASFGRKTAIGGGAGKRGQRGRFRAGSVSGDEGEHEGDDEREREIKPKKLDFGAPVGGAAGEPLSA